jgi:peptide/nickel transport system ATP-binding protein
LKKTPILSVKDLAIFFKKKQFIHKISFDVYQNEILGVVGESGSGKSITALASLGLLDQATTSGSIYFNKTNLLEASGNAFKKIRGNEISMIFQEPMTSLNPAMRCGKQVQEILRTHYTISAAKAKQEVCSLFEKVKLPDPHLLYHKYPHEISGGQKQRVMIAIAIACKPKLLIADEPTTALDVTVQKEIIQLLKALQNETKMSIIFITHDLSLVSEISDRVVVMYKGAIVEQGNTSTVFNKPEHPYTNALIHARPSFNFRLKRLATIADYLDEKINTTRITKEDRKQTHEIIYSKPPLLQVINVKKSFFFVYRVTFIQK